jgi:hypothetical protein
MAMAAILGMAFASTATPTPAHLSDPEGDADELRRQRAERRRLAEEEADRRIAAAEAKRQRKATKLAARGTL